MHENKLLKNNSVSMRGDGIATKMLLIESAGKLIAVQGYAKTTSKQICETAKVNMAAVNYHFGSRDGLYIAVLEEVHRYLMNVADLYELEQSKLSPRDKVNAFLDLFIANAWNKNGWQVKVWARELFNPSPLIYQALSANALPKLSIIIKIFSEYTGLSLQNTALYSCMLNTMAPFMVVFLASHETFDVTKMMPVQYSKQELAEHLKKFAFAGLDAFKTVK